MLALDCSCFEGIVGHKHRPEPIGSSPFLSMVAYRSLQFDRSWGSFCLDWPAGILL